MTDAGDILIGDSHGNKFHVVVFANDGSLLGEFECPHVKVIFILTSPSLLTDTISIHAEFEIYKLKYFNLLFFQVSRCCGLKITSEGYVVTLAKNNHHVLVLNTLYIA